MNWITRSSSSYKTICKMTKINQISTILLSVCREGETLLDKCEQVCICRGGRLQECIRIRREFLHMPKKDRERYLTVVRLVSTTQPFKGRYEALLQTHRELRSSGKELRVKKIKAIKAKGQSIKMVMQRRTEHIAKQSKRSKIK